LADALHIDIRKRYGDFTLNVTENIALNGITAVFGPSGSGKSTMLRLIAGFNAPDTGEIKFNDTVWASAKSHIPPHKRPVGFMFQSGELFPHLSVRGNLEYADKRNQNEGPSLKGVVESFDMTDLLERDTKTLSGGERQRVALARTVLRRPRLLLLDEPLAALDRDRKREILPFLKRLPTEFGMPCLYVSHDIEEVSQIADQIILMRHGQIKTTGAALDILDSLNSEGPIGSVFDANLTGYDTEYGLSTLNLGGSNLVVPAKISGQINSSHRIRIAAKDVAIACRAPSELSIRNSLPVRIETISVETDTPFALLTLRLETAPPSTPLLRARITRASVVDLDLNEGQSVFALVKSVSFAKSLL